MLPGFRFLFAAILLSTSVLVFGLGAAALLRAAHEKVANIPARRAPPERVFAQANDPPPTLAMVRLEPVAAENALDAANATAAVRAGRRSNNARRARNAGGCGTGRFRGGEHAGARARPGSEGGSAGGGNGARSIGGASAAGNDGHRRGGKIRKCRGNAGAGD